MYFAARFRIELLTGWMPGMQILQEQCICLQTPPHDDALALLLAFGSAITWQEDFHLLSSVPCPAHTFEFSGAL
jgi:hypothetical protein